MDSDLALQATANLTTLVFCSRRFVAGSVWKVVGTGTWFSAGTAGLSRGSSQRVPLDLVRGDIESSVHRSYPVLLWSPSRAWQFGSFDKQAISMDLEEKSQTFRKRRLSLSSRSNSESSNNNGVSNCEASASPGDQEETAGITKSASVEPVSSVGQISSPPQSPAESADEKAHTFRKRRLSLTLRKLDTSNKEGEPPSNKRPRRDSQTSVASSSAGSAGNHKFVSKTLHADELIHHFVDVGPPPSPAVQADNVLYKTRPLPPSNLDLTPPAIPLDATKDDGSPETETAHASFATSFASSLPQPKWKRRHTIRKHEHHKLPFPRDIVGTYSCHGMEPIYNDNYYEEQDEGGTFEDGDDWDAEDGTEEEGEGGDALFSSEELAIEEQQNQDPEAATSAAKEAPEVASKPEHTTNQADDFAGEPTTGEETGAANETAENDEMSKLKTVAKINQDRGGVVFPYGNCPKTALFAVYDGHGSGGELVSQFALSEIQRRLERNPHFPRNLEAAFKETFLSVDEALKMEPLIEPYYAGTTACVALLKDKTLTVANVGDSRAVIARRTVQSSATGEFEAVALTEDQNPDLPDEMRRITNAGGYVTAAPSPGLSARVWLDSECTQIGLAMSRSIGDHAVSGVGVISEPVVTSYEVDDMDEFMILASDGVWEFIESAEAVQVVGSNLHRGATKACQGLIELAAAKWHEEEGEYRDDITAIVVHLKRLWERKDPKVASAAANSAQKTS